MDAEALPLPEGLVAAAADDGNGAADATVAIPREMLEPLVALDFAAHVGMRYHAKRRTWFDTLHRVAMVVAALGSSAVAAALYGGLPRAAAPLAVIVALVAACELAFGLAERARQADAVHRRYGELAADIAAAVAVDGDTLRHWERRRLLIRADCEERLLVLNRICYNLEAEARGYAARALYDVKPWQRVAAHIVSLPPYRPERRDD